MEGNEVRETKRRRQIERAIGIFGLICTIALFSWRVSPSDIVDAVLQLKIFAILSGAAFFLIAWFAVMTIFITATGIAVMLFGWFGNQKNSTFISEVFDALMRPRTLSEPVKFWGLLLIITFAGSQVTKTVVLDNNKGELELFVIGFLWTFVAYFLGYIDRQAESRSERN